MIYIVNNRLEILSRRFIKAFSGMIKLQFLKRIITMFYFLAWEHLIFVNFIWIKMLRRSCSSRWRSHQALMLRQLCPIGSYFLWQRIQMNLCMTLEGSLVLIVQWKRSASCWMFFSARLRGKILGLFGDQCFVLGLLECIRRWGCNLSYL